LYLLIREFVGGGIFLALLIAAVLLPAAGMTQSIPDSEPGNAGGQTSQQQPSGQGPKLADLDIEQLAKTPVIVASMDIPVTSVSKQESTVGHSPAAIFVINPEMIRRSGATCIPEVLRMVPGMEVAHIDSNKWAITCRGFNGRYANKLLVLIDGRTVYTPVFSGVYWDTQDVVLEDIERIEVIRGPGGTLWGANAVNGVINVITKKAKDTQGAYVMAGGGTEEKLMDVFRYGGKIGDDGHYRVYGKHFDRGTFYDPNGDPEDAWRQGRFGFRTDMNLDHDNTNNLTVQGDYYTGASGFQNNLTIPDFPFTQPFNGKEQVSGENVLARFRHVYNEDSDWALQVYYDHYARSGGVLGQDVKTYDLDYQYRFPIGERHKITCGAGFRGIHDNLPSQDFFDIHFSPVQRTYNLTSQFLQDEITLAEDRWFLTLGTKLEQNDFTGFEVQPSARLLFTPDRRHSLWGAVSRAVRTPSRTEDNAVITFPPSVPGVFPRLYGNPDAQSEKLMAYEIGFRTQATDKFSWDIAAFYNVYTNLWSVIQGNPFTEIDPPPPHGILPLLYNNSTNLTSADTQGVELSANWSLSDTWRLYGQYTLLHMQIHQSDIELLKIADPQNQVYLRSSWDLSRDLKFDMIARYVDSITELYVPSYISMDLRLGWRPRKNLELAVVGQNLLDNQHLEFNPDIESLFTPSAEVPRGVYGTITYKY
jgi:iron complex outermembrane recepter protein